MPDVLFNDWFPSSKFGSSRVNVKAFGAIGDGNWNTMTYLGFANVPAANAGTGGNGVAYPKATQMSDTADWCGIQAAIDYALDPGIPVPVRPTIIYLPNGTYCVNDTIHLGYGMMFGHANIHTAILEGESPSYNAAGGAVIKANFVDRPIVNIQGSRMGGVRNIHFVGSTPLPIAFPQPPHDLANPANFIPAGAKDDPHAPFCGICIDGYSGPEAIVALAYSEETQHGPPSAPSVAYPKPRSMPVWVYSSPGAAVTYAANYYNKAMSSQVFIEDCCFNQTLIGVMQMPCADGNGDFTKLWRNSFFNLKVGYAIGNSQARNCNLDEDVFSVVHTCIDSNSYGNGNANCAGSYNNMSASFVYRFFHTGTPGMWSHPTCVMGLYGEMCMILGDIQTCANVTFENCGITCSDFTASGSTINQWRQEPFFIGSGIFRNCNFSGRIAYHFPVRCRFEACMFAGPEPHTPTIDSLTPPGMLKALAAFGRVFNGPCGSYYGEPPITGNCQLFTRYATGTSLGFTGFDGYNDYYANSMWGYGQKSNYHAIKYDIPPYQCGGFGVVAGLTYVSGVSYSLVGGELGGKADQGDVIVHGAPASTYFYIETPPPSSAGTGTVKLLTNFTVTSGVYAPLGASTSGNPYYYPIGMLDFYPADGGGTLFFKTTAGSPTLELVQYDGTPANWPASVTLKSRPLVTHVDGERVWANNLPWPRATYIGSFPTTHTAQMVGYGGSPVNALCSGWWSYGPGIKLIKSGTTAPVLDIYTVATLPASPITGQRAVVTDSSVTTFAAILIGGGGDVVPVTYNGGAWQVG